MKYNKIIYIILFIAFLQFSCKKYIEIKPPTSSLVSETVFQNDDQATSALLGIYASMANNGGVASGSIGSITCLAGVSSDELIGDYNIGIQPFYENEITPDNGALQQLYAGQYQIIYTTNAILEGLAVPNGVTPPVKSQIQGEALFIRAFCYFYLVNLFGQVPLQLTTDYKVTQSAPQSSVKAIYQQITQDLKTAENLLPDAYPSTERIRPNKGAVQAILARTFLYTQDWENAEKYASILIGKSSMYNLVSLDSVFLSNSKEAIWQLFPMANNNTQEGNLFILTSPPLYVSLSTSITESSFEPNDKRYDSWVNSYTDNTGTYFYPYKYKVKFSTTISEYSVVLRLAEQYLIRAEADINEGKINQGISDLNIIRARASGNSNSVTHNQLPPLSISLSKDDALLAVEKERKLELFTEWGHRWFDLKRTSRVNTVMSKIKAKWKATDELFPIPNYEIHNNPKIIQNPGY